MVIHSIVSMEDIFNTPEYLTENKPKQAEINKGAENSLLNNEKPFSTDPSFYLKYLS